ncbi:uncharacterized protein YALI1_C17354g [Yarrowia lipolytica]|uniref:Uncharacterized protein n=1 Tax=Yarrowia lipolytica TaxID=4952 RepID=A0A1D8NAV2_YARLL|nr:hypothetical protein YALI1_C17354g [Yarrowia lipolytica]
MVRAANAQRFILPTVQHQPPKVSSPVYGHVRITDYSARWLPSPHFKNAVYKPQRRKTGSKPVRNRTALILYLTPHNRQPCNPG